MDVGTPAGTTLLTALLAAAVLVGSAVAAVLGASPAVCLALGVLAWVAALAAARAVPGWLVLVVAVLVRLPFAGSDFLTDDSYRYVWEGRVVNEGFDPYVLAPDAPELAHLREESHERINHPSYRSIYPPLAQGLFAAVAGAGGRERALRDVLLGIDVLVVLLLLAWRRAAVRTTGLALAYAWCPLTVLSAGSGHVDPLALAPLAATGLALAHGRSAAAGACLALATLAKVFPVLLLPWVLRCRPLRGGIAFAGTAALGFLVVPLDGLYAPLGAFAYDFTFNAPLFELVRDGLPGSPHAWTGAALLAWIGLVALLEPRFGRGAVLALGGLLALSPTVHYWYLSWVLLPAAAIAPSGLAWPAIAWAGSTTLHWPTYSASYLGGPFVERRWSVLVAALIPLAVAVAVVARAALRRARPRPPRFDAEIPVRFAVVIPSFRERENLERLLPAWLATPVECVVVADTPTDDGTRALAERDPRVRYVPVERRGYGAAVLAGMQAAREVDAVVVCDADHLGGPQQVRALLAPLADPSLGLVTAARGRRSPMSSKQRWGNALVAALVALRFGRWFRDLGPFRALRVRDWPPGSLRDQGFGINVEQNVQALRRGVGVVEVALDTQAREHGENRIGGSLRGALRAGRGMLGRLWRLSEVSCAPRSSS